MAQIYWQYVRNHCIKIIYYNICKANLIQNDIYEKYKECFENIDLELILDIQNTYSNRK